MPLKKSNKKERKNPTITISTSSKVNEMIEKAHFQKGERSLIINKILEATLEVVIREKNASDERLRQVAREALHHKSKEGAQ